MIYSIFLLLFYLTSFAADWPQELTSAEQMKVSLDNIKNDPLVILFTSILSVLLSFDGELSGAVHSFEICML